jgi:hypothetical protein
MHPKGNGVQGYFERIPGLEDLVPLGMYVNEISLVLASPTIFGNISFNWVGGRKRFFIVDKKGELLGCPSRGVSVEKVWLRIENSVAARYIVETNNADLGEEVVFRIILHKLPHSASLAAFFADWIRLKERYAEEDAQKDKELEERLS